LKCFQIIWLFRTLWIVIKQIWNMWNQQFELFDEYFLGNTLKCFQIILECFKHLGTFWNVYKHFIKCKTFLGNIFVTNIRNTLNCSQTNLEFVKQTIWFVWWIFFGFSIHLFCIYFWDSSGSPKFSVYIDSVLDPILFSVRIRVQYFSVYKMCLNSSMQLARHSFGTITFFISELYII